VQPAILPGPSAAASRRRNAAKNPKNNSTPAMKMKKAAICFVWCEWLM
jgi:hypothetical protein